MNRVAAVFVLILLTPGALLADGKDPRYVLMEGRRADLPFSDAVRVGDTLYLSGRLGLDPQTGRIPEQVETEVRLLLDGVKLMLDDGWVLCLPDPDEPVTRIWAEADTDRAAQHLVSEYGRRVRQLAR